jgi:predicted nucleic acid-binding protein
VITDIPGRPESSWRQIRASGFRLDERTDLRRFAVRGELDAERGRAALEDLADLGLRRYPHRRLLPRIWELRHNLTAYDAAYVALAEALGAPLVTRDRRLAAAAAIESRAAIEVV